MTNQKGLAHLILLILMVVIIVVVGLILVFRGFLKIPFFQTSTGKQQGQFNLQKLYQNPFGKKAQYANPFETYENPFEHLK